MPNSRQVFADAPSALNSLQVALFIPRHFTLLITRYGCFASDGKDLLYARASARSLYVPTIVGKYTFMRRARLRYVVDRDAVRLFAMTAPSGLNARLLTITQLGASIPCRQIMTVREAIMLTAEITDARGRTT